MLHFQLFFHSFLLQIGMLTEYFLFRSSKKVVCFSIFLKNLDLPCKYTAVFSKQLLHSSHQFWFWNLTCLQTLAISLQCTSEHNLFFYGNKKLSNCHLVWFFWKYNLQYGVLTWTLHTKWVWIVPIDILWSWIREYLWDVSTWIYEQNGILTKAHSLTQETCLMFVAWYQLPLHFVYTADQSHFE